MSEQRLIRERLVKHLQGGEAFISIPEILNEISFDDVNTRPANLPYSFYELFYHVCFTQKDIVKFTTSQDYTEPKWPDYYWPKEKVCKQKVDWDSLKAEYLNDRKRLIDFLLDVENPLIGVVKNAKEEQTLLREILLIIEHSAYHAGQMMIILRLLHLH